MRETHNLSQHLLRPPDRLIIKPYRLIKKTRKIYRTIDDTINIMAMNSNMLEMVAHSAYIDHFSKTMTVVQNDFSVVTKVALASKVVGTIFHLTRKPEKAMKSLKDPRQIVTTNLTLITLFVFVSQRLN